MTRFYEKKIFIFFILLILIFSCTGESKNKTKKSNYVFKAPLSSKPLPSDLVWLTNDADPVFSSPEAKKGGVIRTFILNFPNTFRFVGPDSNNEFATYIDANTTFLWFHFTRIPKTSYPRLQRIGLMATTI